MKRTILIFTLSTLSLLLYADKRTSTLIMPHSSSVNAARELAGWQDFVNIYSEKNITGVLAINPEITLSFRPERIGQCLFGDSMITCQNNLYISGSRSEDRDCMDWLADYFGLPTDFQSCVHFDPRVFQAIVDFNFFTQINWLIEGLYLRIHAPLVYASWDLKLCETVTNQGTLDHDPGYFNATGIDRDDLSKNFSSFISGESSPRADGITFSPLCHSKMSCSARDIVKLSDIQIAVGYNVLQSPCYHLGFNVRVGIPTGNRPTGEYLFEPIIGNGHHLEVGGGISAHYLVWQNEQTCEHAGIYFDMNLTHLFANSQCRSFDLCTGSNSRYMLAQKMEEQNPFMVSGIVNGERARAEHIYAGQVAPVANLTTLEIKVSCNLQADLALMFGYTKEKNSWGFGYGYWAKSCENLKCLKRNCFENDPWALKGDAQLFGFADTADETPAALSVSQSKATIHRGRNFEKTGATTSQEIAAGKRNMQSDNPQVAVADTDGNDFFEALLTEPGGSDTIFTSIQPIFITYDDIDFDSGRVRASAHKIFSHFTHTMPRSHSTPYVSLGTEIEFGQGPAITRSLPPDYKPCLNTALSFWGVWLKAGVGF